MIVRYLLVALVALTFTANAQSKLSKYFLAEQEIVEYATEKRGYELYTEIHSGSGKDIRRPLVKLADHLLFVSAKQNGQEKRQTLDSAFHCIQRAAVINAKHVKDFPKFYLAFGEYYKSEGLYAKALSNYYLSLGNDRDVVNAFTFSTQLEVAEMLMMLNNKDAFSTLLRKLLDFCNEHSGAYLAQFLWRGSFLEKVTTFSAADSITFSSFAKRYVNREKPETNLVKQRTKLEKYKDNKGKEVYYDLAKGRLQTSLQHLMRWYNVQRRYDSTIFYSRQLMSLSAKEERWYSLAAYKTGAAFEFAKQYDSAARYYNLYFEGTQHDIDEVFEIARFFALTRNDRQTAGKLFEVGVSLSKKHLRNLEDLPFNEKKEFVESHKKYTDYLASFTLANAKDGDAGLLYDLVLLTKSVQLTSAQRFANFLSYTSDTTSLRLYNLMKTYKEELLRTSEPTRSAALQEDIRELERRLVIRMDVLEGPGTGISWKEIQNALKPEETAIEVVRFRNVAEKKSLYGALIMKFDAAPQLISIADADQLEKRYFNFYINAVKGKIQDTISYNHFWKPIAKNLNGTGKIYFSADGVYYKLNVNTFYNSVGKSFLLNEQEIVNVLTTRSLLQGSSQTEDKLNSVYLIGSPDFEGVGQSSQTASPVDLDNIKRSTKLAYLPGAKKEINIIDSYLTDSGLSVQSYLDRQATETNLKNIKNANILHIATHGFFYEASAQDGQSFAQKFNTPDPMFNSGLVFAGAGKSNSDSDDGIFTAYEAMDLQLNNTDAVILSACETGLGEIQNGEGVFGLQRGFKIAGAKYIIMSLWKVDDEVTQRLMIEFYTLWFSGMNVRDAFYLAQLNVRKQYPSPYYWGGFVIL